MQPTDNGIGFATQGQDPKTQSKSYSNLVKIDQTDRYETPNVSVNANSDARHKNTSNQISSKNMTSASNPSMNDKHAMMNQIEHAKHSDDQ